MHHGAAAEALELVLVDAPQSGDLLLRLLAELLPDVGASAAMAPLYSHF